MEQGRVVEKSEAEEKDATVNTEESSVYITQTQRGSLLSSALSVTGNSNPPDFGLS